MHIILYYDDVPRPAVVNFIKKILSQGNNNNNNNNS